MGFANEKEPIVYYGYVIIIICYNFIPQLNSKIMVQFSYSRLYLGIETISCRFLQGIVRMGMDRDLKKLHGQRFQVLMPRLQKSPKTILWLVQACEFQTSLSIHILPEGNSFKRKGFRRTKEPSAGKVRLHGTALFYS